MKKIFSGIFTFALCFILLFVFASCTKSTNNNNSNQVTSSVTTTKDVYYTITFKNDDGTILQSAELKEGTMPSYDGTPKKENTAEYTYTFSGWNPTIETVSKDMVYTATYKATVNSYTITLNTDNDVSGTVTGAETYNYGEEITIKATPNQGYTFVGWYDGENEESTEASYTFNMPGKNIVYTAKFSANTNTKYKVEHYLQNIDDDYYPDEPEYVDNKTGITNTLTNAEAKTFEGFKAPTITQENINGDESTVIKLYYERNRYSVIVTKDNGGSVTGARSYKYGDLIILEATPDPGYTFVGWYYLGQQVSTNKNYSHEIGASNFEIHAKFIANTNTKYKVEHYLQNIDDDNYPDEPEYVDNFTGTTDTLTNAEVKTYEGFTSPSITQVNINGDESTVVKLYYTRNSYALTLNKNIDKGIVTGAGSFKYGGAVTITATPNQGYTFVGWYDGKNEVSTEASYTFNMPGKNILYTAKFIPNTDTKYKVEHYLQNLDDDNYPETPEYVDNKTGTTETLTNAEVKTYEGFTSPSITQENINGDESTVIKLYYTRNSYALKLSLSDDNAGSVTGAGTYKYEKVVTIIATPNQGYTFVGWYDGENEISTESKYYYEIESSNATLEARFSVNKYTITINNQVSNATISGITSGNQYEYDSQITLTAVNNSGLPLVWTVNGNIEHVGNDYSFKVPENDVFITITTPIIYTREGNKIYFGTYPQTKLDETIDASIIAELNTKAGDLPTSTDLGSWTDYNYYIHGSITSYMYYQDIDYDNNGTYDYRGVYFTQYRPNTCTKTSSTFYSYQDENGYSTNTIYWFSYDPIEWNILSESNGKALIISNLILDSQEYYPSTSLESFSHNGGDGYANNYELSNIRKFLNDNFYNTAFNDLQKALIEATIVDNSASSTEYSSNSYACNNTNDKMFLLSNEEVENYTSSTERMAKGTDYAKSQGLFVSTSSSYLGNSYWWLRSPDSSDAYDASNVNSGGDVESYAVRSTDDGVRPACWIIL